MDFGALPPEINSGRLYSGPGSSSMLAAADAWDQLASELNSSAAAYRSVIAGLTVGDWQGPSSAMMAEAVSPYIAWMHDTAAEAEQSAAQARTAAGAYQSAFAMTVPPPLIETNRTQLESLVNSNFFGQNSPAIAATEAEYEEMWAQDAAAMYSYANSSAAATRLTPFADPPHTTDPAGQSAQAAAVTQASGTPVGTGAQTLAQLPASLQQLAAPSPAQGIDLGFTPADVVAIGVDSGSAAASATSSSFSGTGLSITLDAIGIAANRDAFQGIGPFYAWPPAPLPPLDSMSLWWPTVTPEATVSAAFGRASMVGTLSVPQTWAATATPAVNPAALTLPNPAAAPIAYEAMPQSIFGESLLGTLAGRGVSNVAAKMRTRSVVPKSPSAG